MKKENADNYTPSMNGEKSYWKKWYIGVIVFLLLQIGFYYLITQYFK